MMNPSPATRFTRNMHGLTISTSATPSRPRTKAMLVADACDTFSDFSSEAAVDNYVTAPAPPYLSSDPWTIPSSPNPDVVPRTIVTTPIKYHFNVTPVPTTPSRAATRSMDLPTAPQTPSRRLQFKSAPKTPRTPRTLRTPRTPRTLRTPRTPVRPTPLRQVPSAPRSDRTRKPRRVSPLPHITYSTRMSMLAPARLDLFSPTSDDERAYAELPRSPTATSADNDVEMLVLEEAATVQV